VSICATDSSEIKRWSTADVPAAKRLDYFAAAVSEAVLPMGIDRADPDAFFAELRYAPLVDIGVTNSRGNAHSAFRGSAELSRSGEPSFNLLMSLQANWVADHRGPVRMAPRDILVIDSRYPLRITVNTIFDAVNISVPATWLRRWLPDPSVLAMRRIPGDSLWGLALSTYLSSMSPELVAAPPLPLTLLADQVGSLLALTASGLQGASPPLSKAVVSVHESVTERIRERCSEQSLTAAEIATSLNISLRTLHRALASARQTFGGVLIEARAANGLRMLRSSLFKLLSIEEIAYRAGFLNASHFSQVIRARTGKTPRQVRKGEG
jgi:AraC-like DNA-binding protein